jgi:multidrug efflux system membrane fusion protein
VPRDLWKGAKQVQTQAGKGKRRRSNRIFLGIALLAVSATGGAFYFYQQSEISSGPVRGSRAATRAAVPVTVAVAQRQDVPIYLTGLGTVQASLTIEIHAKVDGELQQVLFIEGQHVKKGDVLAKIDQRLYQAALDQAKARRMQDAAVLAAAEKDLVRAKTLALKSFDTQQNVDQLQSKADQLKAAIVADEAAMETAQTQLDYTTIVAPSDGRIGIRQVDQGNMVRSSDTRSIATLVLTRPSAVVFTLPAVSLDDVRAAMKRGAVEVTAFDQDNRVPLSTGRLLLIDNTIDQASGTIRLKAIFANEDETLWPGEFVNARLLVETRRNAIAVPVAAVQRGPEGLLAWVVGTNNTAEPRPIEVGPISGDLTIVAKGLSAGDRVVTAGHYKLRPKAPVVVSAAGLSSTSRAEK